MNHRWTCIVALLSGIGWVATTEVAHGQYGGQGSSAGTGLSSGSQAAGSGSSVSAAQGYGLDGRFTGSGFSRYTTGSSAMGTTTAGAGAATAGAFGQSAQGAMGGGSAGNFGRMGAMGAMGGMMGLGRNMFGGMNNMQGQQAQQGNKSLRTHRRLGFAPPAMDSARINTSFGTVMGRVFQRGDYGTGEVTLSMEGRTAVLTGTVESSHARDVAERLALLEPGISEVRNELTVRLAEPTPASAPTSSSVDPPQ